MVVGGKFAHREGPVWLAPLLESEFFGHCNTHFTGKNEKNHFCLECHAGPLCSVGVAESHMSHPTIQIRRASHRDVVRIGDIQKYLDISNIQPYTINSAKIVFLQSRPQPKLAKGAPRYCDICHRSLADQVRFCSILCKLVAIQESPHDFTLSLTSYGKPGQSLGSRGSGGSSVAPSPSEGHEVSSTSRGSSGVAGFFPRTPNAISKTKRRANEMSGEGLKSNHEVFPKKKRLSAGVEISVGKKEGPHGDRNHPLISMSMLIPPEGDVTMSQDAPLSPAAPWTPQSVDAIPRVHHRKQVRPHRAPFY